MTVVRIKWTGDTLEVSVSGHAGYGPKGSDIVCAAVSMLSQSLAAALEQAEKDGLRSDVAVRSRETPGRAFNARDVRPVRRRTTWLPRATGDCPGANRYIL